MAETKEVKELQEKVKVLEKENKGLKIGIEKKPKEPEEIKFQKGQKIADLQILGVIGRYVEYEDKLSEHPKRQVKFIQLKKETRDNWNPKMNIMEQIPTGKIITTGGERSMTVEDFEDFVARRLTAGQVLA